MMAKIGRNEPCPCGSGKKYKRCHGSSDHKVREIARQRTRAAASRVQRERQQGLGKPIISTVFQGTRLVAVKNRLLHSKGWKTFHDFLGDYIKNAIGSAWGNAEIAKPPEQRHPIIIWYQALCRHQRLFVEQTGSLHGMPQTGAAAAYLHLAYDLYALDHNAELQETLLGRLRNHERFTGARYEIQVAAAFIRAGFDIAFEDETDGSTTHCEFTATYRRTGRRFSVEAKRREGYRPRIGRLFNDALSKRANHPRIVCIDLNMRDDGKGQQSKSKSARKATSLIVPEQNTVNTEQFTPPVSTGGWIHSCYHGRRSLLARQSVTTANCYMVRHTNVGARVLNIARAPSCV